MELFCQLCRGDLRMILTRANFENSTTSVMDQASLLLYIHQTMRKAGKLFHASPEFDIGQEKETATKVIDFTREVSAQLFESLFWKKKESEKKLRRIYRVAAEGVDKAIEAAIELAQKEEAIGPGNSIRVGVVDNLKYLRGLWIPAT